MFRKGVQGVQRQKGDGVDQAILRQGVKAQQQQQYLGNHKDARASRGYRASCKWTIASPLNLAVDVLVDDVVQGDEGVAEEKAENQKL